MIEVGQFPGRHVINGFSDQLVSGDTEIRLESLVAAQVSAAGILVEDGMREGVDQGLQKRDLLVQLALHLHPIGDVGDHRGKAHHPAPVIPLVIPIHADIDDAAVSGVILRIIGFRGGLICGQFLKQFGKIRLFVLIHQNRGNGSADQLTVRVPEKKVVGAVAERNRSTDVNFLNTLGEGIHHRGPSLFPGLQLGVGRFEFRQLGLQRPDFV